MTPRSGLDISPAKSSDAALILSLINELADYEKLRHESVATEASIHQALFGPKPHAEAVIARLDGEPVGFALFFHNFSTFLGKPGLYLEDLFVRPAHRGRAVGKSLLSYLAALAVERGCGRFQWQVLDWNRPSREFYERLGAQADAAWVNYRMTGDALRRLAESRNS
ncbi:MAG TPA: GNAT family N-acetyltransferase [Steroidobacteraceae bacterium]|jgi:GNAT superfamily N-acetyltransferase|nr:GNAT family N-acetyltransferase [Steroidobacteraceae bacterium]